MKRIDRITFNPEVMGGKPCIRGLRVTVSNCRLRSPGYSKEDILRLYPYLEREEI